MTDEQLPSKSYSILASTLQSYAENAQDEGNVEDALRGRPDTNNGRFLLIEQSTIDRTYYFTRHDSLEECGEYNFNQEYAEDWAIVEVVDLLDGSHFEPRKVRYDWEKVA